MVPREEDGLHATLGEAHRRYTRHVNFREGWRGHLWQERFHSFVMDERYLLATVRYVERNPVFAGLCRYPGEWAWSSAAAHLNGRDDDLVMVRPMLDRISDWSAYLSSDDESGDETVLIKRHTKSGRPLGDQTFIGYLELLTGRSLQLMRPGRKAAGAK